MIRLFASNGAMPERDEVDLDAKIVAMGQDTKGVNDRN